MFVGRLLQGDLGRTIVGDQPVLDVLLTRFPPTLAARLGEPPDRRRDRPRLGFFAAYKRGTVIDAGADGLRHARRLDPAFLARPDPALLVRALARLAAGRGLGPEDLVLPALTLGLANAAVLARMTRSAMIDIFDQDFVRTGARQGPAARPSCSIGTCCAPGSCRSSRMMGLQFAYMMGGAIVVENMFAWNGVGRLAIEAMFARDYPLIQGFILVFATVVALRLGGDRPGLRLVDPRIRYG